MVQLFGQTGFFADEFAYFQSYGDELWNGNILRLPLTPLLTKALSPLGIEYQNDLGLKAYAVIQLLFSLTGAYFIGKELNDETSGWLSVAVIGTLYTFSFYSARILTDALLTGIMIWFVYFFIVIQKDDGFKSFNLAGLMIMATLGVLTKATFLAVFPIAFIATLVSKRVALLVFAVGFFVALEFVGLQYGVTPGFDRYFLPAVTLFFLYLTINFYSIKPKIRKTSVIIISSVVLLNLVVFAFSFPVDALKFSELEAVSLLGVNGSVAANLPDYSKYYCSNCVVEDYFSFNDETIMSNDWVVLTQSDLGLQEIMLEEQNKLKKDACWNLVFEYRGLNVFKKSC